MNLRLIKIVITLAIFLSISSSTDGQIDYYHFDAKLAEKLTFSAINRIRFENDLSLLRRDAKLEKTASRHTRDMIQRNFFDHVNPDGDGPRERAVIMEIPYPVSENLGILSSYGLEINNVIEELLVSLMSSPEHRANLLNPNISEIGISFSQDKEQTTDIIDTSIIGNSHLGYGTVVLCQLFMKRGLLELSPNPFPTEYKKHDSFIFSANTYKDFDTVIIELTECGGGKMLRTTEIALFERSFEERIRFPRVGEFNLEISGINYIDGASPHIEELATFKIKVE